MSDVVDTHLSGKESHTQGGVIRVVTSGKLGGVMGFVVVYTDRSGKEPHRQIGMAKWCNGYDTGPECKSCSRHNILHFRHPFKSIYIRKILR